MLFMKAYLNAWNYVFEGLPNPFWKLMKHFSDLKYAWEKAPINEIKMTGIGDEYINRFLNLKTTLDPYEEIEKINQQGIQIITYKEENYPKDLWNLHNYITPFVLYFKGNLTTSNDLMIGIVGTRNMTGYGESVTKNIVTDLAPYKPIIISGMADGIDSVAHRAAISNNITTFAVLGFGINRIPYHKLKFAEEIIKNGAVISEYPPDTKAQKHYFPLRNRIISGLSKALIVVEAGNKSGALITARCALDQGREIFAVPGNIGNEKSIGTNRLIRDCAADILTGAEDIITHYKMPKIDRIHSDIFSDKQKKLVEKLLKSPCTKEDMMQMDLFSPGEFNATITELELTGVINKNREGKYYLSR